ncbi:transcriptional regulator [Pseudonocardia sp. Cha107L01]|jgi:hypothetical protein|uniref:transcriptional regulator n=1 Tax=Pseudonocardia sp. Cha107L01 TaxID=3457576 RepID=UPI00403EF180
MTTITSRRATASPAARFAASYIAMPSAHTFADYWAQTTHQATRHAGENAVGRRACVAHVAVYTLSGTVTVCAANKMLSLDATWRGILIGQFISGASHYFADRRHPLRALAHWRQRSVLRRRRRPGAGPELARELAGGRGHDHGDRGTMTAVRRRAPAQLHG